jgi:5'-methylthioadenosine phosphorylase
LAMVTDYDVWHESEEDVSADMVIANLHANTSLSQRVVRRAVTRIPAVASACECSDALATAIITAPDMIPPELAERHDLLVGRYLANPASD